MLIRLGDLLVQRGVLTREQRDAILAEQIQTSRPFGVLAEQIYGVHREDIEDAWAEQYAMINPTVDPRHEEINPAVLQLIGRRQAWQFRMLPLRFDGPELVVCTTQDHLVKALRFVGYQVKQPVYFVLSNAQALGEALMTNYPMDGMNPNMVAYERLAI
jgi:hypothetical protein